jgi:hypothetical protein
VVIDEEAAAVLQSMRKQVQVYRPVRLYLRLLAGYLFYPLPDNVLAAEPEGQR